jgi:ribonuclease BN (tRNA processing enzyme)
VITYERVSCVRLTVLGCSGSAPGPHEPTSGYLLEADGFALGLELGNGTLAELSAVRDPLTLDALMFSHLHPDHCADFSALTVLRHWHPHPPADSAEHRLPVYAPVEAPDRFAAAYAADRAERETTDMTDVYDFRTLTPGTHTVGPFAIQAFAVTHPCETYGFRFTHAGRTLAYTADTGVCDALDDLASGVDVLLGEASWTHSADRPAGVHLSGRELGELAARAQVGHLLITHIAPWTDRRAVLAEAGAAFDGAVELVTRGGRYTV